MGQLSIWNPSEGELVQWVNSYYRGDQAIATRLPLHPRVNASASEKEVVISFDLPGVEEKDIQLNITAEGLVVSGEKKGEVEEKGKSYYRLERTVGSFERTIPLPEDVEPEKAAATFRNGVLKVVLPKNENRNPNRKIQINSAS